MKFRRLYCLSLCLALGAPLFTQTPAPAREAGEERGTAWIIPIQGDIEPSLATFVRREGRKALNQGADFLIFEIDTFGGRVDSALQITSFITSLKDVRTIAWVNSGEGSMGVSWSAGALIAMACQDIYMAAGTSLGAAAPVTVGADGQTEGTGEKTVAAVRSQMAALAERNNHPVEIARAMVDYDVELWEVSIDGGIRVLTLQEMELLEKEREGLERRGIISPKGKLLSLTSGEAQRYGLARGLVDDRDALLSVIGAASPAMESAPSAADSVISLLTSGPVQAILIVLGLVMIFLEINSPGFGIPGVAAILAFATVFGAGAMLGRVGSLEIILFLIGLALLVVEIFITPGFGVMGISGFLFIGFSLLLSMQDFVIPRFDWEWTLLGRNVVVVIISLIAAVTGIAAIILLGPRIRLFDKLTLRTQITGTAAGPLAPGDSAAGAGTESGEGGPSLVGKIGIAATPLHPVGRVEIDGEVYEAQAEGLFVERGRGVKVTRVRGNTITVRLV
ncbi:MAG: nodulation protein NfeD [Treponema sp.]|jgi:membrane-bound serine protease (ClpP class)|nr:nodulation protein NfeD [Treponema sp.]